MSKRTNDVSPKDRWFVGEVVEVNGEFEYKTPVYFCVPAGKSLDRITTLIQVEQRLGVPDEILRRGDAAVDEYLAELPWDEDGEPGEVPLWCDETVCNPVRVVREIDRKSYELLCKLLEEC